MPCRDTENSTVHRRLRLVINNDGSCTCGAVMLYSGTIEVRMSPELEEEVGTEGHDIDELASFNT